MIQTAPYRMSMTAIPSTAVIGAEPRSAKMSASHPYCGVGPVVDGHTISGSATTSDPLPPLVWPHFSTHHRQNNTTREHVTVNPGTARGGLRTVTVITAF